MHDELLRGGGAAPLNLKLKGSHIVYKPVGRDVRSCLFLCMLAPHRLHDRGSALGGICAWACVHSQPCPSTRSYRHHKTACAKRRRAARLPVQCRQTKWRDQAPNLVPPRVRCGSPTPSPLLSVAL